MSVENVVYIGTVVNYRTGLHKQKTDQCLLKVKDMDKNLVRTLIGYKVSWPHNESKIFGKITGLHGRSGTLRAKFQRGLPGQALGSPIKIYK